MFRVRVQIHRPPGFAAQVLAIYTHERFRFGFWLRIPLAPPTLRAASALEIRAAQTVGRTRCRWTPVSSAGILVGAGQSRVTARHCNSLLFNSQDTDTFTTSRRLHAFHVESWGLPNRPVETEPSLDRMLYIHDANAALAPTRPGKRMVSTPMLVSVCSSISRFTEHRAYHLES